MKQEAKEMPVVLLSLHETWWGLMKQGKKVLEIRKTMPKCGAPFKVLVYITGGVGVVGEFICPGVIEIKDFKAVEKDSCVSENALKLYAQQGRNRVYGWLVADVREYPKKKTLKEIGYMKKPPQSWCYYMR